METQKPHVALLSSPGLGHLIPVIELAKRFVIQHDFKATVLAITCQNSEAQTHVVNSALNTNLIDIIEIPGADITPLIDPNDDVPALKLLSMMMHETKPALRSALCNLTPHPSIIILDLFTGDALSIAEELKVPKFVYVASHAWFLSLVAYSPTLDKQVQGQYVDRTEPLKIPGCKPVQPEDVLDSMQDRNHEQYKAYLGLVNKIIKGDAFLVNTWEDLQQRELQALRNRILNVPVYGIGPLVRQSELATSSLTESVVEWLDKQPNESVIYVSFGSGGTLLYEQIMEVAWGLEQSGYRFVWVVRLPSLASTDKAFFQGGEVDSSLDENDPLSYLPKGFLQRNQKMGILVSQWAPQVAILSHPSVGGFLSHCGWSSTVESIVNGVPMIAWPLYAEQSMNATLLVEELGVAVRPKVLPTKKVVDREEIADMVREIMEEVDRDGEPNPIRERMKGLKHSAVNAVSKGGSSYTALSEVGKKCEASLETQQV